MRLIILYNMIQIYQLNQISWPSLRNIEIKGHVSNCIFKHFKIFLFYCIFYQLVHHLIFHILSHIFFNRNFNFVYLTFCTSLTFSLWSYFFFCFSWIKCTYLLLFLIFYKNLANSFLNNVSFLFWMKIIFTIFNDMY